MRLLRLPPFIVKHVSSQLPAPAAVPPLCHHGCLSFGSCKPKSALLQVVFVCVMAFYHSSRKVTSALVND